MLSLNLRITVKVCPQGADMSGTFTSKQFFQRHAPDFNFELNEQQLVEEGLKRGFIERHSAGINGVLYQYKPTTAEDVLPVIRDNGTDASEMVEDMCLDELYGEDNV